jgi:glycine cleavage system H protein
MAQVDDFYLPDDLYYDKKDHLWARLEEGRVRVGLDQFGQKAAGTVAYLRLLPAGRRANKGRPFGSLEAGKYVGPLRAPVSGEIVEVNEKVVAEPTLVNTDSYGEGWFVVIEPSNLDDDLADLAHGDEVLPWLEFDVKDYKEKGLLTDD